MADEQPSQSPPDPFGQLIGFYDAWTKNWSKSLSDMASSQRFVETVGENLDSSLETMALLRKQGNEMMEQTLQQMNLPTRSEIVNIAERLTRIEMALDDLDAKVDEVLDILKAK